jgi:hypothetical protein
MAFFFDEDTQRRAEDFKTHLYESAIALAIKHETIARCLTVSRVCVTQWLERNGDRHFPAALIPQLPKELALETLRHLGSQLDVHVNYPLDGKIDDEVLDLDVETGEFIRMYRDSKTTKAALITQAGKMRSTVDRMIAEVEHK